MAYGDVCWECEGMWEAKIQFPGEISSFQALSSPDSSPWVCQGFWWANKMPRVETMHPDHVENYTFSPRGRAPSHSRGQGPWVLTESAAAAAAAAKSLQLCPTLFDPIDGSPPGSPVPGILQARTLEWVAISFSNASKWKVKSESEVAQSCLTLSDPMDCSLPGSSIHGIFQARVLEWGAIAFSTWQSLLLSHFSRVWLSVTP